MPPPSDLFIFIIAPFIGSFLSTLFYRLPAGENFVCSRSRCPDCKATLSPLSLVPVLSWIVQRGRCRECGARIAWAYPAMELAALGIAVWASMVVSGWLLVATCILGWASLALGAIDAKHLTLPDILTLPLLLGGLAVTAVFSPEQIKIHLLAVVIAYALFAAVAFTYVKVRGRDGLGRGDAKLFAVAGAWVGLAGLPGVLMIACGSALVFALVQIGVRARYSPDTRIAFGPFLALGTWIIWLYGPIEMTWKFIP